MQHGHPIALATFVTACIVLTALAAASLVSCAAQTGDGRANRQLISQAVSTAITAREALTPAAITYATAQAKSDIAESALEDAITKSERLSTVFERGHVLCGVHPDKVGLSIPDDDGAWSGFFVDMCRAVATALFGNPNWVQFIEIAAGGEGKALTAGDIDILATGIDWTMRQEAEWGNSTLPVYFGGQAVIVKRDSGTAALSDLPGETACTVENDDSEHALLDWASANRVTVGTMRFSNLTDAVSAYELGFCSALTETGPELSAIRRRLDSPFDSRVLPGYFAERVAVLAVPTGNDAWFDVVKFVVTGLVRAEMLGVTSETIEHSATSQNIAVRRLGGYEGDFGQDSLYLSARVMQSVIGEVGNYGEIYDRHFGPDALDIERGRNRLVRDGGSIWVPPIR